MKAWLGGLGLDPSSSWHFGFLAAGIGMTLGLLVLARARSTLAHLGEPSKIESGALRQWAGAVLATAALMIFVVLSDREGLEWLRVGFVLAPALAALALARSTDLKPRRLAAVLVFFVAAMIFFAIFEQAGVTIALFADRLMRTEILGFSFPSAWVQSLNPLFVIVLAPLFALAWVRLGPRQPSSPVKFALGLAFLAASFLLMVPAAALTAAGKASPLWIVGLFFLQTVGELLLSPVGLSAMTKLAPVRTVGLILGVWFLSAALGNKLAGVLGSAFTGTDAEGLADFFLSQGLIVGAAAAALLALAPWVRSLMGGVR
jgi:POT family proton-dependent oligopeptide transporter